MPDEALAGGALANRDARRPAVLSTAPPEWGAAGRGGAVAVADIFVEDYSKVSLAEDLHSFGALGCDGSDESFGEAVRPRAAGWDRHDVDAGIGEDHVE